MIQGEPAELELTRQRAVDALCEHFANDALSVEEFERRVEAAHRARSREELREIFQDLPSGDLPIRREPLPVPAPGGGRATIPASRVKERNVMVALMGGVERKGRWIPARTSYSVACMGGIQLDFREALLAPGVTEVWIFALMGGAEIIVPPGLLVESNGVAVMGGFDHREDAPVPGDPHVPVLSIRGFALMGGVEVSTRLPGETEKEARQRLRLERKVRKRLGP